MKSFFSSLRKIDRTKSNLTSLQNHKSIDLHSVRTAQPGKRWSQSINLLKISTIATLSILGIPSIVRADGIYMTNMKSTLTQSSINLLTAPSRTPGVQPGDIMEYVLEAKVANAAGGPGVYFTTYIPNGVEVLGAWFVTDATGATVRAPGQGGQAHNGWGPRGEKTFNAPFNTLGNSRQSDLYGDTGIFYSTDSRTQLFTSDNTNIAKGPTGNPQNTSSTSNGYNVSNSFYGAIDAFNLWDADQVKAFGRSTNSTPPADSFPTSTAPIINLDIQGATPFGLGSPVAGPNTGYTRDNTGLVGPWNRIQYSGSSIADVTDGKAAAVGTLNTATLLDASSLGTSFPLTSTTNAVRWSDGLRLLNEVVYVKIRVKINAPAIAATTGTLLNFEANGSDNWGSGSRDNPWRYFGPTVPQSAQLFAAKEVYKVNGVIYTGGVVPAGATITYRVRYLNLSSLPVNGVSFKDTLPTPIATIGCTALLPTLSSLSNSVTVSSVTSGTATCPAAAATVTFGNLPNVTSGVIPALRGGEFTYDVKLSSTATNGTVVTNNANFSGQDIVSSVAVSTTSAISVTVGVPIDYSDAPISGTAPNGTGTNNYGNATHNLVGSLKLGANIDSETASIANADASGDGADDDGITLPNLSAGATSYSIPAANITATGTGTLHAWIDFNKNGTFEAGEYTSVAVAINTPVGALTWSGINAGAAGDTFARFRLTTDTTVTSATPSGNASNGEVEDYQVSITQPQLSISGKIWNDADTDLTINGAEAGTNAGSITLTVYAINTTTGKIIDKATVNATNGSYQLSDIPANLVGLKLRLSNIATLQIGDNAPASPSIPTGWFFTGESLNGTIDPVIATLGDIALTTTTLNLTNENFGIRQSYTIAADPAPTTCAPDFRTTINTGIDASGNALSVGSNDLNWTAEWIAGPASGLYTPYTTPRPVGVMPAVVTGKLAGTWIAELANAKWISYPFRLSPNRNGDHRDANLDGTINLTTDTVRVKYTARVTLPSNANTISVSIPVGVSVDNQFASAKVNGVENIATPSQNAYASGFTSLQSFNLSQGWQAGVNTIEIVTDSGPPYTGFFLSVNATTTQVCVNKPNLLLVKRITAVGGNTTNGNISLNSYDPETDTNNPSYPYDKNVIQSGITPPNSDKWPNTSGVSPISSTFLLGARNGGTTKPNDTVEYTIYFLSAGDSPAKSVLFCDRVPANTTFIPNSFNNSVAADPLGLATADRGIAISLGSTLKSYTNISDGDIARYYPPLSEPINDFPKINCGGANTNGAVVVNLGNRPNATGTAVDDAAAGAFGFVRFRGQVK